MSQFATSSLDLLENQQVSGVTKKRRSLARALKCGFRGSMALAARKIFLINQSSDALKSQSVQSGIGTIPSKFNE